MYSKVYIRLTHITLHSPLFYLQHPTCRDGQYHRENKGEAIADFRFPTFIIIPQHPTCRDGQYRRDNKRRPSQIYFCRTPSLRWAF